MHDIIIIGSGIAGSYLANSLSDFDVLVLEKEKGVTIKDSGIVSTKFSDFIDKENLIKETITRMDLVSQHKTIPVEGEFAYLLERKKLSYYMRKLARPKHEKAERIDIEDHVSVTTNKGTHEAKLLIGADGASSLVRKSIGINDPAIFLGMLVKTFKKIDIDNISVYFNKYFSPEFFSWAIPKKEYGLITATRPSEYLDYFKHSLSLPNGKLYASPIPIGYTKSFANRALLVGDSCGQIKPITGGGIIFALTAARHAATTIRMAFKKQRFDEKILSNYEKAWKKDFGNEIKKQLWLRKAYRKFTNNDIEKLFNCVESITVTDYDHLSASVPKLKLLGFALSRLPILF